MQTTGHKSLAVRTYKETSDAQQEQLSHIVAGSKRPHSPAAENAHNALLDVATDEATNSTVVNVTVSNKRAKSCHVNVNVL